MVQIIDAPRPLSAVLGEKLAQGVSKNFPDPQQMVQRGMLEEAMGKMGEESTYEGKLKAILPILSTTPGGNDILSAMMPLMQRQAASEAYDKYYSDPSQNQQGAQKNKGVPTQGQAYFGSQGQGGAQGGTQGVDPTVEPGQAQPGQGQAGSETTFPLQSTDPQPVKLMTPDEMNQRRRQLNQQYNNMGVPVDPAQIEQILQTENKSRIENNQQLQKEKEIRGEAWDKMAEQAMTRFKNSDIQKSVEDETVFKKFVDENRFLDNPNAVYQAARDKYRQFENARLAITKELDLPGPITKMYRQGIGSYKSKDDVIDSMQPHVKVIKELGLVPELRNLISGSLGFGGEDTERTIFPPSKEVKKALDIFKPNPDVSKETYGQVEREQSLFPSESYSLKEGRFEPFKSSVEKLLNSNPDTNLINLRGRLNQDKKYGWQDINRAVVQLIDEGRFSPNQTQEQQLNVIKHPPMPGLMDMFKYFWSGKK